MDNAGGLDNPAVVTLMTTQPTSSQQKGGLDFSQLTPIQFGITTESFLTSSKLKDKSRVAQLKARRMSSIGVRGSPETNSLICFRAKQNMKTPPETPQQRPFSPTCNSLKQKMAAFQRLIEEEEEEEEENLEPAAKPKRKKDGGEGEDEKWSNDFRSETKGRENDLTSMRPPVTPPPSKRRCRTPLAIREGEIRIIPHPIPESTSLRDRRVGPTEFLSPKSQHHDLGSCSQTQLLSSPVLTHLQSNRMAVMDSSSTAQKKRVWFGAQLSPEFFDKTLPPSTPLQKGATPVCPPSSGGPKLRSLLKTPQRANSLSQPDFSSPQNMGASPTLASRGRYGTEEDERDTVSIKISFPSMEEEFDHPVEESEDDDGQVAWSGGPGHGAAGPFDVDTAFQLDAVQLVQKDKEQSLAPGPSPQTELEPGPVEPEPEGELIPPQLAAEPETVPPEPAPSCGTKRKHMGEHVRGNRRATRSAAASASREMKRAVSVKRGFGSKEVDRSLYGRRNYASKNPLLSPVRESLTATPTHTVQTEADQTMATIIQPSEGEHADSTSMLVTAAALWRRRYCSQVNGPAAEQTSVGDGTETDSLASQSDEAKGKAKSGVKMSSASQSDEAKGKAKPGVKMSSASQSGKAKPGVKMSSDKISSDRPTTCRRSSSRANTKRAVATESSPVKSESETGSHPVGTEPETAPLIFSQSEGSGVARFEFTGQASSESELREGLNIQESNVGQCSQANLDTRHCDQTLTLPTEPGDTNQFQGQGSARRATRSTPGRRRRVEQQSSSLSSSIGIETAKEKQPEMETGMFAKMNNIVEQEIAGGCPAHKGGDSGDEDGKTGVKGQGVASPNYAADLAPWQQSEFCIDDVLKPMPKSRGSVRRSLRNQSSVNPQASGLAWVDHTSPDLSAAARRRTRGRLRRAHEPRHPTLRQEPEQTSA